MPTKLTGNHGQLHRVGNRDNWQCVWCHVRVRCPRCFGKYITDEHRATRDHEIPRSKGGSDEDINIVMACRPCNEAKDDLLWKLGRPRHKQPEKVKFVTNV